MQRGLVVRGADLQSKGPRFTFPLLPLEGFIHSNPVFKSSATLVNSQLVSLAPGECLFQLILIFFLQIYSVPSQRFSAKYFDT